MSLKKIRILLGKCEKDLNTKTLSDTIGLFYLCYVIMAYNFSEKQIAEFLYNNSIGFENQEDHAKEIKNFYYNKLKSH